jgi:hypothetical protein
LDRIISTDFQGTVQCDGYAAYPSFANSSEGRITLAACWAHARHKFNEVAESTPQQAGWMLLQIQHLYRIENNCAASNSDRNKDKPCVPVRAA